RRQIGTGTLEALGRYATEREVSMMDACRELGLQTLIPKKGLERIRGFADWMERVRNNCHNNDPVAAIREMISDINYEGWLHQNASSPRVAEKRMENVWTLVDSIKSSLERHEDENADGEEK